MRTRTIIAIVVIALGSLVTLAAPSATALPVLATDWNQYHGNQARAGYAWRMPTYHSGLKVTAKIALDGAAYASPIVANGLTIVATENNTVYAFNSANHLVWKRHLAAPSPAAQRPCGNIDPLGITGTPIYYARTGLVYVAVELSGQPPTHRLYGLNVATGTVKLYRSLDLPGVDSAAMQERGALAYANGRIWVPFGGLAGDCGAYKGRVVGYLANGSGLPVSYTVPTAREAGMWAPPGPAVDKAGDLYLAVGNGASGVGDAYDHSDSVLRIHSSNAKLADSFSPSTWPTDNDADLDLGSQGATIAGKWVFAAGKSGTAYVLLRSHFGGIGGQVSQRNLCRSFGGTAVVATTVFVPCADGLRAVSIDARGVAHVAWHAANSIVSSPIVGGGQVWVLDAKAGVLHVLDQHTGAEHAAVSVGVTSRFSTPAVTGRRIFISTLAGLTVLGY